MRTPKKSPIDWLFPRVRKRVLSLLLMNPQKRWHLRDVARKTGCSLGAVGRELARLSETQIIQSIRDGNRRYYQANRNCPLFPDLSGLIRKTAGLVDILAQALQPLAGRVVVAFVYGSHASGAAEATSDVDLMVLGDVDFADVASAVMPLEEQLGREINPTVFPPGEFCRKLQAGNHFLQTVVNGEKVFLIGSDHDVRGLVRPRVAPDV